MYGHSESEVQDFRGQRGGRRKALLERPDEAEQGIKAAEVLVQRSISLAQLVFFYKKHEKEGRLAPQTTCWEVLQSIIIPATAQERLCYVDVLTGTPKKAECMVSHWMGASFRALILAIAQHTSGILALDVLERRTFVTGLAPIHMEKSYWLCMFAANPHRARLDGHALFDVSTLGLLLERVSALLVVLDEELGWLARAWCAAELYQAWHLGKELHFAGRVAGGGEAATRGVKDKRMVFPGLERSSAASRSDKERLVTHHELNTGVTTFDQRVQELVLVGVRELAWREALRDGSMEVLEALLHRGTDVNCRVNRQLDTALTWATQYNCRVDLLDLLLGAAADPNLPSHGGWTPLLYAAQLGSEEAAAKLLAAQADPCAAAQNGRTALLEAAEREDARLVERLLDARADPTAADSEGAQPAFFATNLGSPELCQRLGWKNTMRRSSVRQG